MRLLMIIAISYHLFQNIHELFIVLFFCSTFNCRIMQDETYMVYLCKNICNILLQRYPYLIFFHFRREMRFLFFSLFLCTKSNGPCPAHSMFPLNSNIIIVKWPNYQNEFVMYSILNFVGLFSIVWNLIFQI